MAQFHQPHVLLSRARHVLEEELPGTVDRLVDAGCVRLDFLDLLPRSIVDRAPRDGDDRFPLITGRRPVIESTLAAAAVEDGGVDVRRGVGVASLVRGNSVLAGVPHVVGVRTTGGDELSADLVVDATGRRTKLPEWLVALGGRAPEVSSEEYGFVYNTRYFTGPALPAQVGPPVADIGSISLLTTAGDNGTWSVTVWSASVDTALRGLRDADRFTSVVRACPLQAHWVDAEPITDVLTMAGVVDRHRRFVVDGEPIVTGVAAVGDAWACTNRRPARG